MALFIDTGNIKEIKQSLDMGIIRGVTTNPTILAQSGVTGGMAGVKKAMIDIAHMIAPYPLSVELTKNDSVDEMIAQAIEFSGWAKNIVIKVPIHGPNGEIENMRVIHQLEKKHNIRVNVTAMMSVQQCFLAAMAGATYISIFCGRINNMGYNSINDLKQLRKLLDMHKLPSQIICASTREILNVVEWLDAGGHIVTVVPKFIEGMIVHPYTKETVQMFLNDAKKFQE